MNVRNEIKQALNAFNGLELDALLDAVSQYIENSEEVEEEDELSERDQAKVNALRSIQDALIGKFCALAS